MADPVTSPPLERASIFAAHELIKPYVHRTPVLTNATLTALASTPRTAEDLRGTRWADRADRPARPVLRLWFKCENFQRIGAFKPRGAFHAVERLKLIPGWLEGQGRTNGVVTASSGKFPFFGLSLLSLSIIMFFLSVIPGCIVLERMLYNAHNTCHSFTCHLHCIPTHPHISE